jgi:hypothetical protein
MSSQNTSTSPLASTFEEFAAEDDTCQTCGDEVRPKWTVDGECPGCHYGEGDRVETLLEGALEDAENPAARRRVREALQLRLASGEEGV